MTAPVPPTTEATWITLDMSRAAGKVAERLRQAGYTPTVVTLTGLVRDVVSQLVFPKGANAMGVLVTPAGVGEATKPQYWLGVADEPVRNLGSQARPPVFMDRYDELIPRPAQEPDISVTDLYDDTPPQKDPEQLRLEQNLRDAASDSTWRYAAGGPISAGAPLRLDNDGTVTEAPSAFGYSQPDPPLEEGQLRCWDNIDGRQVETIRGAYPMARIRALDYVKTKHGGYWYLALEG